MPQTADADARAVSVATEPLVQRAFLDQPQGLRLPTVADVPRQAGEPGAASGRQRRQARNPAASASAAVA